MLLDFDKPNAPGSTQNKAVFSGRALVDPIGCYYLNMIFSGHNREVTLIFPEKCRAKRIRHYCLGWDLLWFNDAFFVYCRSDVLHFNKEKGPTK